MGGIESIKSDEPEIKRPETRDELDSLKLKVTKEVEEERNKRAFIGFESKYGVSLRYFNLKDYNPVVLPGQKLGIDSNFSVYLSRKANRRFNDYIETIHDPIRMNKICNSILKQYEKNYPNMRGLTPQDAIDLTAKIVRDHLSYDMRTAFALAFSDSLKDKTPQFDSRTAESLLDSGISLSDWLIGNGVCRNYAQVGVIVFEALKLIQDQSTSRLENSFFTIQSGDGLDVKNHAWNVCHTMTMTGVESTIVDITFNDGNFGLTGLDQTENRIWNEMTDLLMEGEVMFNSIKSFLEKKSGKVSWKLEQRLSLKYIELGLSLGKINFDSKYLEDQFSNSRVFRSGEFWEEKLSIYFMAVSKFEGFDNNSDILVNYLFWFLRRNQSHGEMPDGSDGDILENRLRFLADHMTSELLTKIIKIFQSHKRLSDIDNFIVYPLIEMVDSSRLNSNMWETNGKMSDYMPDIFNGIVDNLDNFYNPGVILGIVLSKKLFRYMLDADFFLKIKDKPYKSTTLKALPVDFKTELQNKFKDNPEVLAVLNDE